MGDEYTSAVAGQGIAATASTTRPDALHSNTASEWETIFSDEREIREINRRSLRKLQGIHVYQIAFTVNSTRYSRTVVANCQNRTRFEVLSADDWRTQPFKSVFPGTRSHLELDWVCVAPLRDEAVNAFAPYPMLEQGQQPPPEPAEVPRTRAVVPAPAAPAPAPAPAPKSEPPDGTGSGFFVAAGKIITNSHVTNECRTIRVRLPGVSEYVYASLQAADDRFDLALVSLTAKIGTPLSVRASAQLGEDIMVAGFPLAGLLGTDIVVASGQINSLAGLGNDASKVQISAPVQPGNSGGPVLDRTGAVVGVVVSKLNVERVSKVTGDFAQNVNFAIKPEVLRLFLDANLVRFEAAGSSRPTRVSAELAQVARGSTVQVLCLRRLEP